MKTKYFLLILLFYSVSYIYSQTSGSNGWYWQYPKPQGNTLRDIFVFNKDTAIAVGDLSTIIKTTDGGINWTVQSNVSPSKIFYCVKFIDALNGWAAGGNYLVKTSDGGKSWTEVKRDTSIAIFAIYFVDADTGFVFGEDGYISRTTDGGSTWKTRQIDDYIGGYQYIFNFTGVTFTDKNTGWLIGNGYYGYDLYKTIDCGRTWTWNGETIPNSIGNFNYTDICFVDKNHGFISGDEVLKTTDGGISWQNISPSSQWGYTSVSFTDTLTGWLVGGIYCNSIFKTTDGGNSWTALADTMITMTDTFYKVRFSDKNSGWIVGRNGKIYRTTDSGYNWTNQSEDKHIFNSVYFVDENNGWAVGGWLGSVKAETDSGIVLHTTNGGNNWEKQISSNNIVLKCVYAFDNNNVIAVGEETKDNLTTNSINSIVLKSTNGGQTWQTYIDTLGALNSVCFPSRKIGYTVGKYILKTEDGGVTWNMHNNLTNLGHVQFIDENIGWVGQLGNNNLYKTTDGGNNWITQIVIDTNVTIYSFYFCNSNIGWAVGDNYLRLGISNIYKTTNGGQTWFQCNNPFPSSSYTSVYFSNENTGWAVGADNSTGIIIKTTDGGNTWNIQDRLTPDELSSVFMLNENTGWVIGSGIFKTTNGGGVVHVKDKNGYQTLPQQITLHQNYPNPFNPSTVISWQLTSPSHATLKIYDILGREVVTLVNKNLNAGPHSINWDASKMASGVYFYRLRIQSINGQKNSNFIETKKMLLLK